MSGTSDVTTLAADQVRAFAREALAAIGMPPEDAAITADVMAWNELRGAAGHGLARLIQIRDRSRAGGLNLRVDWTPLRETAAATHLDAHDGWGPVAGTHGMRLAIGKARATGIGVTVVRNSDVTSAMGWYPAVACEAGLIGLAITNSVPLMPPWGGRDSLLGNQAFAIGAPAGEHPPLIFDTATSAYNMGLMKAAAASGDPIPAGTALDEDGNVTTDPAVALRALRLLPMGGHRGGGLAILWEVLTGVLGGGRMLTEVTGMDRLAETQGLSLFLLAIDPAAFMAPDEFRARVDRLIDAIHASPPAPGVDAVRVPGERKAAIEAERLRDGIPYPEPAAARLRELAAELGIAWPGS